jgi:hypothetical protein
MYGKGQAIDHSGQITVEPSGKRVQLRQLIALHRGDPLGEAIAAQIGPFRPLRGPNAGPSKPTK